MKIENLKTVGIEVEIVSKFGEKDGDRIGPLHLDFIYGTASNGLSPFEIDLHDKSASERLEKRVPGTKIHEYFGTLAKKVFRAHHFPILPESFVVKIRIVSVQDSDEKDIVKAIASSLSHGCGHGNGGCDCGCS